MAIRQTIAQALAVAIVIPLSLAASPTTVTFTKGVNGYTGAVDWRVNEPGKTSDWGGFALGAPYLMVNEQAG